MDAVQVSWLRNVVVRIIGSFLFASVALLFAFPGVLSAASSEAFLAAAPPLPPIPPPEIEVSNEPFDQVFPETAYNWKQDEYLIVWLNTPAAGNHAIWGRRVSVSGEPRSTIFEITSAPQNQLANPAVAYDPVHERYLVVWGELSTVGDWDLYGRFIPWEGPQASFSEFSIVIWTTNQWQPQIVYARTTQEFLLVWATEQTPYWVVNGFRISSVSGAAVGSPLSISHPTQNRWNPVVAYNMTRNEYLVAYDNGEDVLAQRFSASGVTVGPELMPAGWPSAENFPSVAACSQADQYLVSWQSNEGPNGIHGYVRYIDGNGQFPASGGPYRVDQRSNTSYAPVLGCGVVGPNETGGNYLVTWEAQFGVSPVGVWGRFYGDDFTASPLFGVLFGEDALNRAAPAVVGGEGNFLVAGMQEVAHAGTLYYNIRARLISPYSLALPYVQRQ